MMTGTVATQVKAIAFDRDIERLTEGFTGREWVFEEVDRWLQQDHERFFILTGEPGLGKSAIAAQLTQTRKDIAAYHFCIARQISTVEPNNVLLSLAAQLIKYFPDYGEALVNTVKPLFLQVNVEINIENIRDSVVQGVVIENLHIHYPKQALDIVLRQALAALPNPPKEPVSILIDSLDEAVTYSNENNLVTLLSSVDDLPSWVRFILTSRPDKQRVLSYFETLKPYYYHLNELSEKNKKDIHQYVDGRVVSEPIQAQIQRFQVQSESLINQITELSKGNFLYTKVLLDDIELGEQPIDNLAALPKSLNELYHNFLLRLKAEWEEKYQPIFGILTVTKAPVTEEELANLLSEQLKETELRQHLRVVQQFLDVVQNDYVENTYTLFHQSLQDYLSDKEKSSVFHCSPKDGHRQIIECYWRYHPRDWRECDRYGLRYLATHLVDMAALEKPPIKARKYIERLHELLATEVDGRNAWFDAKDANDDTRGYLADVALARKLAEEEFDNSKKPEAIALQHRYALITTSVNSLVGKTPSSILIALVENKVWSAEEVLAYALNIPYMRARAWVLKDLAPHLPFSLREQIWQEAVSAVLTIVPKFERVMALSQLLPYLRSPLKEQALQEALSAALSIEHSSYRKSSLKRLLPHLPDFLKEQALQSIFAVYATESKAIRLSERVQTEESRLADLVELAPYLSAYTKEIVLEQALSKAETIAVEQYRMENLRVLAPHLPESLKEQALTIVQGIEDDFYKALALKDLAPYLPSGLQEKAWQQALNAANAIEDISARACNLGQLASHLPPSLKEQAWQQTLSTSQLLVPYERVWKLRHLALHHLPDCLKEQAWQQALSATQAIEDEDRRMLVLKKLAPHLPKSLKNQAWQQALSAAQAIEDEDYRRLVLKTVAPYLSSSPQLEDLQQALSDALAIGEQEHRMQQLRELALCLSNSLKEHVLSAALTIKDGDERSQVLMDLVPYLPNPLKKEALQHLQQSLHATQAIKDGYYRALVLNELALYLPESLKEQTLSAAQSIEKEGGPDGGLPMYMPSSMSDSSETRTANRASENEGHIAQRLSRLAPHLLDSQKEQALSIAQAIKCGPIRAMTLTELAPYFPAPLKKEALQQALITIQSFEQESHRAQILNLLLLKIAPNLPDSLKEQALSAAQSLEDGYYRALALSEIAPYLSSELKEQVLKQALSATLMVTDTQVRPQILRKLIPQLVTLSPMTLYPLWRDYLIAVASQSRPLLLEVIGTLTPVVVTIGGTKAVEETVIAVQDIGRWWP